MLSPRVLPALMFFVASTFGCGDSDATSGTGAADLETCPSTQGTAMSLVVPFATDGEHLFHYGAGAVVRTPVTGGAEETVCALPETPWSPLALNGSDLYFLGQTQLWKAPKAGGTAEKLADVPAGDVLEIATNGVYVYWTVTKTGDMATSLLRAAATPGGGAPETLYESATNQPGSIAAEASGVYWLAKDAVLYRSEGPGASPEKIADSDVGLEGAPVGYGVALSGESVFWAAGYAGSVDGRLFRAPKTGGDKAVLIDAGQPTTIAIAEGELFTVLTGETESKVARMTLDGSGGRLGACYLTAPFPPPDRFWMTADANAIYVQAQGGFLSFARE